MNDTRTARISIRCTEREKEQLQEAAQASGESLTDFVLNRCLVQYTDYHAAQLAEAAQKALEELYSYIERYYTLQP